MSEEETDVSTTGESSLPSWSGTFAYAADEMSGNVLVVYPASGQMEDYISGRSLAEKKESFHVHDNNIYIAPFKKQGL